MKITQFNAEQVAALEAGKILRLDERRLEIAVQSTPVPSVWWKFDGQGWNPCRSVIDTSLMFDRAKYTIVEPEVVADAQ